MCIGGGLEVLVGELAERVQALPIVAHRDTRMNLFRVEFEDLTGNYLLLHVVNNIKI
jgi:hypothetical protein